MLVRICLPLLAVVAGASAPAAQAQTVSTIPVTFTGTVSTSFGDSVKVKQADGSYTSYSGPMPSFPYENGQAIAISFNATVANAAYYAANPNAAAMTRAADGQYRITLMPETSGLDGGVAAPGIGTADRAVVTGGIAAASNPRSGPGGGGAMALALLYNATTDTYSIAPGSRFVAGYFAGPGYVYDGATGQLVVCQGAACDPKGIGANLFSLLGNADGSEVSAFNVPILDSVSGALAGLYTMTISGRWGFGGTSNGGNGNAGSGGQNDSSATPVPEPLMLPLLGAALFVPVYRRRRAK